MQAVGTKNRTSLHSIDGSAFKTRGSLSIGKGGHVRKRRRGSLSFGISMMLEDFVLQDVEDVLHLFSGLKVRNHLMLNVLQFAIQI